MRQIGPFSNTTRMKSYINYYKLMCFTQTLYPRSQLLARDGGQ